MGKKRRKPVPGQKAVKVKVRLPKPEKPIYNSDEDKPDERSDSYIYDAIDKFKQSDENSSNDEAGKLGQPKIQREAVYDFSDSEDEDEMEARLHKLENRLRSQKLQAQPSDSNSDVKAWGATREDFYGSDVRGKGTRHEGDPSQNAIYLEEEEVMLMQRKLNEQMDEDDYGFDVFGISKEEPVKTTNQGEEEEEEAKVSAVEEDEEEGNEPPVEILVKADMSILSDQERQRLIKERYPEFMTIVTDFHSQYTEYKERLQPILHLFDCGKLPESEGLRLLRLKAMLILDYCTCAQFYLLLRAERSMVDGHPVIKRMIQFKKLLRQIENVEQSLQKDVDYVLSRLKDDKDANFVSVKMTTPRKTSKKVEKTEEVDPALSSEPAKLPTMSDPSVDRATKLTKLMAQTKAIAVSRQMQHLLNDPSSEEEEEEEETKEVVAEAGKKDSDVVENDLLFTGKDDDGDDNNDGYNDGDFLKKTDKDKSKDKKEDNSITAGEQEALQFYAAMRRKHAPKAVDEAGKDPEKGGQMDDEDGEENREDGDRRGITQQVLKSRGLVVSRNKKAKISRVRHRLRYKKKTRIYNSIVPKARDQLEKYTGEKTGIRGGRIRSVALS